MISYQTENFGKRYEYRSNPHKNYVVPPHIHDYSELAFTKEGVTTVIVNGQRYLVKKNHLIFILPNQIHEYTNCTSSVMRCCVFSNDHIPAFFEQIKDMQIENPIIDMSEHKYLLDWLDSITQNNTLKICGILNLICELVINRCEFTPRKSGKQAMLYDVIQYVSRNFHEDVQLKEIAKKLGYHEKYLSAALHALTGMNFRTFLSSYRVNYAKGLLRYKGDEQLRVSDIALQSGFLSINSFNRVFKEITGLTPSEYRNRKGNS